MLARLLAVGWKPYTYSIAALDIIIIVNHLGDRRARLFNILKLLLSISP